MMRRSVIELYNVRDQRTFLLQLAYEGPGDASESTQRERGRVATKLCSTEDLSTPRLDAAASAATTLVGLLHVTNVEGRSVDGWPRALRDYVFRGGRVPARRVVPGPAVGFFLVDRRRPNVLEYICVTRAAKRLYLGQLLYQHYELWYERQLRPGERSRIFLAAVAHRDPDTGERPVVRFYESLGFELVADDAMDAEARSIDVPSDALLMSKWVGSADDDAPLPTVSVVGSTLTDSSSLTLVDVDELQKE